MSYEIRRQRGIATVYDPRTGETMHPGAGPWAEANGLYVQGAGLPALLGTCGAQAVVIFDVGLGAAANALAALACRQALARRVPAPRPLHIVSFERDLDGVRLALEQAAALAYPLGHEAALQALLEAGRWQGEGITWELRLGDFSALIDQEPQRADAIFFDPFSPQANPEMWTLPVLEALYRCRRLRTPTRLLTYSASYGTRAALLLAGFFVGEGPQPAHGGHSSMASTWFADLPAPLTPAWLRRWRRQAQPWPVGSDPRQRRAMRAALQEHSQWLQFGQGAPADEEGADAEPRAGRARPAARRGPRGRDSAPPGRRRRR
ncbi:MAG: methyltransferase [Candidatus Lambdaproteobacteria bacterium]|nr:methyltransferase [Candidatus Lambdaproteobacteria bacterium]